MRIEEVIGCYVGVNFLSVVIVIGQGVENSRE